MSIVEKGGGDMTPAEVEAAMSLTPDASYMDLAIRSNIGMRNALHSSTNEDIARIVRVRELCSISDEVWATLRLSHRQHHNEPEQI